MKISRKDMGKIIREIGAIPINDRQTWHRTIPNYYIAKPYIYGEPLRIFSAVAYMLSKSAASKCRNKAIEYDTTRERYRLAVGII